MTDENIIAIVAIVVSGVVSVATLVASFYTNRANNRAKLKEIAFSKQIEILKDLYKSISENDRKLFAVMDTIEYHQNREEEHPDKDVRIARRVNDFTESNAKFQIIFYENKIFIPLNIDHLIEDYIRSILDFRSENLTREYVISFRKSARSEKILSEIRKFVGFK